MFGSENNPYLREQSTWPPLFHESRDIVENLYAITNTNQEGRLRTTITKTWHRREDFVGLWGYFQDQPTYSAVSQFASYYTNLTDETTRIHFNTPVTSFEQSQVLIQTFQSAFSSWGGAFGVAWGFFYFLFGAPRMDPFGFFALYILGKSTKRIIANRYFAEKKDSSIINNHQHHSSSNSGSDPSTKVSQRGHGSTSALSQDYNHDSNDLEAQQKKELRYRDLEARIFSLEAVLDDFYLDLSPFRKEKEEEQQQSRSWISRTFSSKTKDENDGAFVQMDDKGVKTSYESESYRMGQMQRDRTE
ncbi:hypothetical protein BGZ72_004842 [Mortierella alpina]|nr:hypothetical protein BGZ72_004842 [Mortierella alpina]